MINIKMQPATSKKLAPSIFVIGAGGAGGNAVNNMIASNLDGCQFLVCNSDAQALDNSLCDNKVQLGANVTGGLGAGSRPEVGKAAAEESIEQVMQYLEGVNMVFVTAGMGGGTGTGAAPIIAKACREKGILTVGVVTKPFHFEGSHRMAQAEKGIDEMQQYVDTLIVIPNQNLFRIANEKTTFAEAFKLADSVLQSGVRGVTDLMVRPGLVNLDFADIRTAMLEMGKAMMGTGEASGDKRAIEAAEAAINNPLLDDVSMKGARGVIINVTGGYDMTLFEADEACNRIRDEVDADANIIFGATFDSSMDGKMRVSIVATGIEREAEMRRKSGGAGTRTLERAVPNATIQQPPKQQAPSFSEKAIMAITGAEAVRHITAPTVSTPVAAAPVAEAVQEPETDMFENREFETEAEAIQNTALRGTRFQNSFIPPKPADAQTQAFSSGVAASSGGYSPYAGNQMAAQPRAAYPGSGAGLQLNPPRLTNAPKKHAPSLFERITGSLGGFREGHEQDEQVETPVQQKAPTLQQAPLRPSQGSLNIESPAGKPEEKSSELDIPAFLRRQAN